MTITNIHGAKVEVEIRETQACFSADSDYGPSRWEVMNWKRNNPFQVISFGEYGNTLWTGSRESCEGFIAMRQSAEATSAIAGVL